MSIRQWGAQVIGTQGHVQGSQRIGIVGRVKTRCGVPAAGHTANWWPQCIVHPGSLVARRYATWIMRHRWAIVIGSIVLAVISGGAAARLTVFADFSSLLPQSVESVRDLRAIEKRARSMGTVIVAVRSDHPDARKRAALILRDRAAHLPLVASVTFDEKVRRAYAWKHRWLFARLEDLEGARDTLKQEIARAENPLYVDLEPAEGTSALRDKLRNAETQQADPGELVSKDGKLQMMIVRTTFPPGDVDDGHRLLEQLDGARNEVRAAVPDVDIGLAGDIVVSVVEHNTILQSMLFATIATVTLVLVGLVWFFRSTLAVGALSWSLVVGTVATFAFTKLTLGYLNLATAFLSSIVIGNGINASILVTSRYLEELRRGRDGVDALATAIETTLSGTLAAALTACVAYGSLVLTVFRGFRHFGVIGAVGIALCWLSAYTVLPAALAVARQFGMKPRGQAPLGRWLARLLDVRDLHKLVAVTLTLTIGAAIVSTTYLASDPFERNFQNLRSHSSGIAEERRWRRDIDEAFGKGLDAAFAIAVQRREDVALVEKRLRDADAGRAPKDRLFSAVLSIDDLLPDRQPEKLAVLAEIRDLLSPGQLELLDDEARAEALRLLPPKDLHAVAESDIPDQLAEGFIEADGSRGKLMAAAPGTGYEVWDAHDTQRFVGNVRALNLPPDVHLGGSSFVFADVIRAVNSDGPRATLGAIFGAIVIVLVVIGRGRHGLITLLCGLSGTLLMIATAAIVGLRVNFLDFVALPITIGIGIEYAVNIVTRERQQGAAGAREALATTGGAVFLCSYTTIIGYGSLLLSQNRGISSFGLAAMLGEIMCLFAALLLAPALLLLTSSVEPAA
ncbi:MAG: exporters of the superfamily [Myxococcales bacterium]|nr:exporters of the superfamily [Myxococcales bacterium]